MKQSGGRAGRRPRSAVAAGVGPRLSARRAVLALVCAAYAVVWGGGVASHLLRGGVPDEQQWLASLFLLLAAALTLLGADGAASLKRLALVALVGFAAEVAGVRLGVPFGPYRYTEVLRPQLLGVPVVIAAAWMTLAAYVKQILGPLRLPAWAECAAGAAWLTAVDLVIDPLAAGRLGYWRWLAPGSYYDIPAANFAGWFLVGLPAMLALRRERAPNLPARAAGLTVVLFFTLLAAAHGLRTAALVGLGLCAADLCAALLRRRPGHPAGPAEPSSGRRTQAILNRRGRPKPSYFFTWPAHRRIYCSLTYCVKRCVQRIIPVALPTAGAHALKFLRLCRPTRSLPGFFHERLRNRA